jgi:CheY-like chemotaxis protein
MKRESGTVLIVDDDADIRELLKIILETEGYSVNVAADGLDALQQLQAGMHPVLILLDLMMPRMDGEQFVKKMRSTLASRTPVVIMSGHVAAQTKAHELDADCCLMKPVECAELLATVKRFARAMLRNDVA